MVTLNLEPLIRLTNEQFSQLCQANPNAKLERNATGELVVIQRKKVLSNPNQLSGEDVLLDFILDLKGIMF